MRVLPFSLRLRLRRIPLKLSGHPKVPAGVPSFAAGPFKTFKVRNKILAGGKTIIFGNNVSEFKNKSRRTWRPNIKRKHAWSETLERRIELRMTTSVMRTIEKAGGLDAYLTECTTRRRLKELGPRGWELRAKLIRLMRERERGKYVRMFQRSIMLCPMLRMDSEWQEFRPFVQHTEGYAVLPEHVCKKAFESLMERMRKGRQVVRRGIFRATPTYSPRRGGKVARRVKTASHKQTKIKATHPSASPRRPKPKTKAVNLKSKVKTPKTKLSGNMRNLDLALKKAQTKAKKRLLPKTEQSGLRAWEREMKKLDGKLEARGLKISTKEKRRRAKRKEQRLKKPEEAEEGEERKEELRRSRN